jgi:hypothetical protein
MKNTLELVAEHFGAAHVPYLVVGGWAVGAHGISRMTDDTDILISDESYDDARKALEKAGFREWKRNHLVARFEHGDRRFQVIDLMFANLDTFGKMYRDSVEATMEGCRHHVPHVDHLLAMKLHALKQGAADRRSKDAGDVLDLARVHHIDLQSDTFRNLCMKFGGESVYDYLLKLAGIR